MENAKPSPTVPERPWVDFDRLVADCVASHKDQGLLHNAIHEQTIRRGMAMGFGSHANIAEMVGGRMEFQDCSPPGDPKSVVRYRLWWDGAEPMVFEGIRAFSRWVDKHSPVLKARAEKHAISQACSATESSVPARRPRGL